MSGGNLGGCDAPSFWVGEVADGIVEEMETDTSLSLDATTLNRVKRFAKELKHNADVVRKIELFVHGDTDADDMKKVMAEWSNFSAGRKK